MHRYGPGTLTVWKADYTVVRTITADRLEMHQ